MANLCQVFIWLISSITVFWLVFRRFRHLVDFLIMCNIACCSLWTWIRVFFKNSSVGGGHLQKGTILYRVWRNNRWFVGNKKFGVVSSHLLVGGGESGDILPQKIFVFFYPYDCNSLHFLKQIFGYTALHYAVDRLNLQLSTCIVCLCRYLAVTQGASLINLGGPTPTKRHHGWHRAGKFCVSKLSEMAFSKSSLPLFLGPFINYFIMICESMLYPWVRMDYYEKFQYQNIDYRYLIIYIYIYMISNILSPLIKHWVGGTVSPCFLRPLRSLTCLAEPCNNSNLYGLGNAIQWKMFKI
jgi:hypothetical protein